MEPTTLLLSNNPQLDSPWLMGYKAGAERAAEDYRCLTTVMPSIKLVQVSTFPQRKAARALKWLHDDRSKLL
jgi:hypothetical protein